MDSTPIDWWTSIAEALAVGERLANNSSEFDAACVHIVALISDAALLLEKGSSPTAAFLAITALEEIAKVHVGMYRQRNAPVSRHKDPMYRHGVKHQIAASTTVGMGHRLPEAIGESRMRELLDSARTGGLVKLREASLYIDQRDGQLHVPQADVSPAAAREVLLLAIEAFDDALAGETERSNSLAAETDALFEKFRAA